MEAQLTIQRLSDFLASNRIRLTTGIVLFLILEDVLEGVRPRDLTSFQDLWGISGLILVLLGISLRSWAAGTIHKDRKLATYGPYTITRHPLYIGSFLMMVGFSIIIGDDENIWFVLIIFSLFYLPAIRKEELKLRRKFGEEWRSYVKRTSLLFPKKIPANILSRCSLEQWVKNREYRACAASLIILIALGLIRELQVLGLTQ